jgi:hypothetical protein
MSERDTSDAEPREVDAHDLAHDEVEPDPDVPPGPVPDAEREITVDRDEEGDVLPDLGDFEGNLDA